MSRHKSLYLCLCIVATCRVLSARDIFVSVEGSDHNPGTKESPVATISTARDLVRNIIAGGMTEDLHVNIGQGSYFLEHPVIFDERDSGRDGHMIIYKGAPELKTRIYGGRRIVEWKKLEGNLFESDIFDLNQHFTLYENESAANGGYLHTFQDSPAGNWRRDGTRLKYQPRNLPIEEQIVVLGTAKDVFVICGRSMDRIAENIVFDGLYIIGSDFAPVWKKGATYSTTWDGEYDGRNWRGQPLCDAVLAPDMRHGQFYIENARKVTIRNCKLYGAGFMSVFFNRWAQDNVVENCWIENAGCNGVFFMGWECGRGPFKTVAESYINKRNTVRNSLFYDIGRFADDGAGIYLCFSGDNIIEHNRFHGIRRYGVATKGWRPKLLNEFHCVNREIPLLDPAKIAPYGVKEIVFYDGYVVTEDNQGAELLHSRNNIIRFNDLSQIPRDGSDSGMIEMWGAGTGNRWEYNACHDAVNCGNWDDWLHVLFNDDGSHGAILRGNIIYWIAGGGRSRAIMMKGNDQSSIHNIIADCELDGAATIGPFTEPAHDMVWSNNVIAAQMNRLYDGGAGYELVGGIKHSILKEAGRNIYYYQPLGSNQDNAKQKARMKQQLDDVRKSRNLEMDSILGDPNFDRTNPWWDATMFDYRLKSNSPALALGFEEIDKTKIGLQPDFPFNRQEVLNHPAGETWKAANFSRIYKNRVLNGKVHSRSGNSLWRHSWIRYSNVDFGEGQFNLFRTHLNWVSPKQSFETVIGNEIIAAKEYRNDFRPIPYWEVSPVFTKDGMPGPKLFDVQFPPEKTPETVKWTVVKDPLTSASGAKYPLGVINLDLVNGGNSSNGSAYMRSSVYVRQAGKVDSEIRGAHGIKVWVNGTEVFSKSGDVKEEKRVSINLNKGWNQFLVKVVQSEKPTTETKEFGDFWASISFHHGSTGATWTVPGLPGKEVTIQPNDGTAMELRLDAPDGQLIGALKFGEKTCSIQSITGRHDLFMIFPNENVETVDWFRFEK